VPLIASVIAAAAIAAHAGPAGRVVDGTCHSPALGGRLPYVVYTPVGYDGSRRLPVLYFLHGLPASPNAYRAIGFLTAALETAGGGRALIVAPRGTDTPSGDPEYLDLGPGRDWQTAITRDLPRCVDASYRTIASRRGRALIGVSAGGYGAMLAALHHLDEFSVVESWSGYFVPTNPAGTSRRDLGSAAANAAASAHEIVRTQWTRLRGTFLAFYVGSRDRRFLAENRELDAELTARHVPHVFAVYPGGHDQALWTTHAAAWVALALRHLAHG